jgi:hypothetical protein
MVWGLKIRLDRSSRGKAATIDVSAAMLGAGPSGFNRSDLHKAEELFLFCFRKKTYVVFVSFPNAPRRLGIGLAGLAEIE